LDFTVSASGIADSVDILDNVTLAITSSLDHGSSIFSANVDTVLDGFILRETVSVDVNRLIDSTDIYYDQLAVFRRIKVFLAVLRDIS
jgi:hypothetical protein